MFFEQCFFENKFNVGLISNTKLNVWLCLLIGDWGRADTYFRLGMGIGEERIRHHLAAGLSQSRPCKHSLNNTNGYKNPETLAKKLKFNLIFHFFSTKFLYHNFEANSASHTVLEPGLNQSCFFLGQSAKSVVWSCAVQMIWKFMSIMSIWIWNYMPVHIVIQNSKFEIRTHDRKLRGLRRVGTRIEREN